MTRRRSRVARVRRSLYAGARILGHVRAVQTGRVPQRAANVLLGRAVGRLLRRVQL